MKTWVDVALDYFDNNVVPVCPVCGSTGVSVSEEKNGNRFSVDFLCEKCGSAEHLDGFVD